MRPGGVFCLDSVTLLRYKTGTLTSCACQGGFGPGRPDAVPGPASAVGRLTTAPKPAHGPPAAGPGTGNPPRVRGGFRAPRRDPRAAPAHGSGMRFFEDFSPGLSETY